MAIYQKAKKWKAAETCLLVCLIFIAYKQYRVTVTTIHRTPAQSNIGFLKVHKAGSSTLLNIFMRYAFRKNLTIALPTKSNIIHRDFNNLVRLRYDSKFNMLVNHVKKFERWKFEQVLHWDSTYVAIVRDPLELTISAFQYYYHLSNSSIYSKIPGENKLKEYLNHREKYDPIPNWNSYTNNRMALDFGVPVEQMRNRTFIEEYVNQLDLEIDLVLVLEYFSESLILLKRHLGWTIKDILYVKRNENNKKENLQFTQTELSYHRNFSLADNILYDHFVEQFRAKVAAQGNNFKSEVNVFNKIENEVVKHCQSTQDSPDQNEMLVLKKTYFNEPIIILPEDCQIMLLPEYGFVDLFRWKYFTEERLAAK